MTGDRGEWGGEPFLRQDATPRDEWDARVAKLRAALLQTDDLLERERLTGRLADALRCDPERVLESIELLDALVRSQTARVDVGGDARVVAANLIRLATALQYANRHALAMRTFERAVAWIQAHEVLDYEDFAYQHMGKCQAELGRLAEADASFARALELRSVKNDPGLLASTRQALGELERRRGSSQ